VELVLLVVLVHLVIFFIFFTYSTSLFSCNGLWIFMSVLQGRSFSSQLMAEQPLGFLCFGSPFFDGSKLTIN